MYKVYELNQLFNLKYGAYQHALDQGSDSELETASKSEF